jgi:acetyl esterase/lipase
MIALKPIRLFTMHRIFLILFAAMPWALHADSTTGIEFAKVDGLSLKLDLHRPAAEKPPLIVYVHGGAWRAGSREDVPIAGLLAHGFAIASVDYRLSTQARFPAQIHDIKAAIRFLRAKADELKVNTSRIAIIGSSAGGHLAALAGLTNDHEELECKVGDHLDQSSHVNAIVSFYGASNLQSILSQSTEFGLGVRIPALKLLLGDLPEKEPALAILASPVAHLDAKDPPLLMIHGDADPQMPLAQSEELQKACEAAKIRSRLITLPGSKHGGAEFYDGERLRLVAEFLSQHLRP